MPQRDILSSTDDIMAEAMTVVDALLGATTRAQSIGVIAKALMDAERRGVDNGIKAMTSALTEAR